MILTRRHALLAGFALALLLLGSVESLNWRHSARAVATASMLTSSHKVRDELARLQASIMSLDAWQRTNLLADKLPSIQPLEDSLKSIADQQRALEQLIVNPEQKANAVAMGRLVAEWSALVQSNADERRNSSAEAMRQKILVGPAAAALEKITTQFGRLDARGHAFVTERSVAAREEARNARLLTATGIGLSFALLITVFGLVLRENRLRRQIEQALQKTNEQLEQRVRERTAELAETIQSLNRSERRFRAVIEHSADCIALIDADYKILYLSPAVVAVEGYQPEELIGHFGTENTHPDDLPLVREITRQLMASPGKPIPLLWRRQHKDGQWLWLEGVATNLLHDPAVGAIVTNYRDITERKRAEDERRKSEEHFRFLNDLGEATRTLADPGQIMEVMARMLGEHLHASRCAYADVEQDGEQFTIVHDYTDGCASTVGSYQLSLFGARAVNTLQSGHTLIIRNVQAELSPSEGADMFHAIGIEAIITCPLVKDGSLRAMMAVHSATPRDWQPGEIAMVQDVVERCWATIERSTAEGKLYELNVELEQRVVERTAQLEAANKELEAFSYSVSHDLRAPLRAVDGFSQAVLEDFGPQLPAECQRQLQTIRESAQQMGALIDDLLMFARFNRQELGKRIVDTGNLVRRVLDELGSPWPERQVDIRIGNLPACNGDSALLKQVWLNLVSNALKYTRGREPAVVEIGCIKTNGADTFFVRDNGTGFDMRYAGKLFGVFQRLHRAEDFEGTGVGLAIVQRIVHRHGGRVWADAVVDQGATFYFTLEGELIA